MQSGSRSQHYSNFDVNLTWDIQSIDGQSVIEGALQNVRYAMMENVELRVVVRDRAGTVIGRAVDFVMPVRVDLGATAAFRLTFPMLLPQGARLVFSYAYEGNDGGEAAKWFQSFDSFAP